jgi:hypothetical protein
MEEVHTAKQTPTISAQVAMQQRQRIAELDAPA